MAGSVNLTIALAMGYRLPGAAVIGTAGAIGLAGYGISLVLFVLALRHLGTARAGAYFSSAPFAGALIAMLFFGERPGVFFWLAAALTVAGLWLHLTESHAHHHVHVPMKHEHTHIHDEHHQHEHAPGVDTGTPHSHRHEHAALAYSHAHYPDMHHRHRLKVALRATAAPRPPQRC